MPRLQLMLRRLGRDDRSAVGLMFGILAIPLAMVIGVAIDYALLIKDKAQLDLAADAAAMHAVRVASQTFNNGQATTASIQQAGQTAGQQWFAAQMGSLNNAAVSPTVTVTYTASPSSFTANVAYSGSMQASFGGLFNIRTFSIAGSATATISTSYVEVLLMLDNSGSMMIGASLSDMVALERATPCSTQGVNEGQAMNGNYSWNYTGSYGYGSSSVAPPSTVNGVCDPRYTGDPSACAYVTTFPNISSANPYRCTNGGGTPATVKGVVYPNMPNSPCAFACHNNAASNDYYGLARSLNPPIQLRLDVVQQAAANVVTTLQSRQQVPNQFLVGVYQFNATLQQRYPAAGSGEAGTDLTSAIAVIQATKTPPVVTSSSNNTDFHGSATALNQIVSASGNGQTTATPKKILFIVTDGMQNFSGVGPMTSTTNEQYCSLFWSKGFNLYVLYTPYLPLPNPYYLNYTKASAEPTSTSPIVAALRACARYSANFFQASDPAAIDNAMQTMLTTALNAAGRVAN